jgi:hypothetical protein
MTYFFSEIVTAVLGSLLDPVLIIPALIIGVSVHDPRKRVAGIALLAAILSIVVTYLVRRSNAILPSDTGLMVVAGLIGRFGVALAIAQLVRLPQAAISKVRQ